MCTRDNYGPGVYNILAYVPEGNSKDDIKNGNGVGYVFAIWPFHYEEIYDKAGVDSQVRGKLAANSSQTDFVGYNSCDGDQCNNSYTGCEYGVDGSIKCGSDFTKNNDTSGIQGPTSNTPNSSKFSSSISSDCPSNNTTGYGNCSNDYYSVINHEIDIEIPNNSPAFGNSNEVKNFKWD